MDKETFDKYYRNLLQKATKKRAEKEAEYFSKEDVLNSFRRTADFRDVMVPVSIMDLAAKSLVSISDMVDREFLGDCPLPDELPTLAQWDEKFIDAINYLLKLYASIREEREE